MNDLPNCHRHHPADLDLPTHPVRAFNLAASSENKIHDDTVARRFGFKGALAPGVEVFACVGGKLVW